MVETELERIGADAFALEEGDHASLHLLEIVEPDDTLGRSRLVRDADEDESCVA